MSSDEQQICDANTLAAMHEDIYGDINAAESMLRAYIDKIGVPFRERLIAQAIVNLQEAQRKLTVLKGE